ncbi:hypothetical protein R3P38DRAFT_2764471 [Favolaschia claudopus]|uniref:Uncharacterized protein n=1 Tax=Favolaschia claudopus TaxID=2862362 RepID=A0AAW0DAJ0_9AGAR
MSSSEEYSTTWMHTFIFSSVELRWFCWMLLNPKLIRAKTDPEPAGDALTWPATRRVAAFRMVIKDMGLEELRYSGRLSSSKQRGTLDTVLTVYEPEANLKLVVGISFVLPSHKPTRNAESAVSGPSLGSQTVFVVKGYLLYSINGKIYLQGQSSDTVCPTNTNIKVQKRLRFGRETGKSRGRVLEQEDVGLYSSLLGDISNTTMNIVNCTELESEVLIKEGFSLLRRRA